MNGLVKALTCILGVLAAVACLATIGIIGYTLSDKSSEKNIETVREQEVIVLEEASPVPTTIPEGTETAASISPEQLSNLEGHVHDYEASEEIKATCYQAGRIKYTCECGDSYYVDVMSTGHVADDWEVTRKPTAEQDGIRVKKCIYCDEIMAQENVKYEGTGTTGTSTAEENHVHQYTAETVREPSCTLAGLRKYSCSCGNFYTEMIPAPGHVASDWAVAAEATSTQMGTEQRICTVCGVLLDSRPVAVLSPSPSASAAATAAATTATGSASPAASASSATTAPTASPSPSPTPHTHNYTSYVLKDANCTEKGIRSFVCDCGSSYAESIELNLNNHTYRAVVIPATQTTQGYTIYTCIRCNYSYFDNYTPALSNQ